MSSAVHRLDPSALGGRGRRTPAGRTPLRLARHVLTDLPGPNPSRSGIRSDGLEGYVRTFLLAALRVAGAHGDDPHGHLARYAVGLAAGTEAPATSRVTLDPEAARVSDHV